MRTLAILAGLMMLIGSAATSAAESLLANGGFVDGADGWDIPEGLGTDAGYADDEGYGAAGSLRLKQDGEKPAEFVEQVVTCEPNTEYVLAAWLKCDGLEAAVQIVTSDGGRESVISQISAGEAQWQEHSARFNSGRLTEVTVRLVPHVGQDAGSGQVWVDDVRVVLTDEYDGGVAPRGGYAGDPPGENIALGRPYTLAPKPAYSYSTDEDDAIQLTDGEYTVGYFWTQTTTVGWQNTQYADITIDLGEVKPIVGCSFNTAAGVAGVAWPATITILASDDGQDWYSGGDLIALSAIHGLPTPEPYTTHRFVTDALQLHGRYFRLMAAPSGGFLFCDEIEVYEGTQDMLALDLGDVVTDPAEAALHERVAGAVRKRLLLDIAALKDEAAQEGVSAETHEWALAKADGFTAAAMEDLGEFPADWRAVHPLTPLHAEIYRARARVKRDLGATEWTVWTNPRYDLFGPTDLPEDDADPSIEVDVMRGEYRAATVNITNMSDEDAYLDVGIERPTGTHYPGVHQVEWIETQAGIPVPDALPIALDIGAEGARVHVPAGMTRQIWFSFDGGDTETGTYSGELYIYGEGRPGIDIAVPTRITVHDLQLPEKLHCSLGMWDYSCAKGYDMTEGNVDAAIVNMQEHFVDTPWLSSGCVAWPDGFDAEGNMVGELDFERFDSWIADWRDATNYAIFLSVNRSIRGVGIEDERFGRAIEQWMNAWVAHCREIEVDPSQLLLLLVDEPHALEQDEIIIAWANAIKSAEPEVVIWEDPTYKQPDVEANLEMLSVSDVLCPNLGIFGAGTDDSRRLYLDLLAEGKELWFYQCSGPAKTHDPYYYHRLQSWYSFKYGATGQGFWAYADASRAGTSWNELRAGRACFTPIYIEPDAITDGKHMEAIREGLEDYEILYMLREHADKLEDDGKQKRADAARKLLADAIDAVCGEGYSPAEIPWTRDKDRTVADTWRVKILEELTR